jgi:hypothetical protein
MSINEIVEREVEEKFASRKCEADRDVQKVWARAACLAVAKKAVEECAKIVWKERMEPMGSYRAINQIRALVADEKEPK